MIREALVSAIKSDAAVAAAVGSRVFPLVVPQSTVLPAVTWQLVSMPRNTTRDLAGRNLITAARFQVAAVSKALSDCQAISKACREALDAFAGRLGNTGVTVVELVLVDEFDDSTDPGDGTSRALYRVVQEYLIRFREPVPARLT